MLDLLLRTAYVEATPCYRVVGKSNRVRGFLLEIPKLGDLAGFA